MTRGDVYMLDFGVPYGSEPGYRRSVDERFCCIGSSDYCCG